MTVLVVGQTPPPIHGQSLAIQNLLQGSYDSLRLLHVRMEFSSDLRDVGKPKWSKAVHLARLIARVARIAEQERPEILYYPPAGPDLLPALRDVVLLSSLRPLFPRIVLHFLAAGVSELLDRLPRPAAHLLEAAYADADCAIQLSTHTPPDATRLRARRTAIVPLGIASVPEADTDLDARRVGVPRLLYVGHLVEAKGVGVLLEACASQRLRAHAFDVDLYGDFADPDFERYARALAARPTCRGRIRFHTCGDQKTKWSLYAGASIFCFPSHYEREAMPLVLLEAMQFALPIVATRWRGIVDLVEDGETGVIVPCRDPAAVAEGIERLLADPVLRRRFGECGRARYASEFTLDRWRAAMERVLVDVAHTSPADAHTHAPPR